MKRQEIYRKLARQERLPEAAARDQVNELVHRILRKIAKGESFELPGLGKLVRGPERGKRR